MLATRTAADVLEQAWQAAQTQEAEEIKGRQSPAWEGPPLTICRLTGFELICCNSSQQFLGLRDLAMCAKLPNVKSPRFIPDEKCP
jgi:hypothetical protein